MVSRRGLLAAATVLAAMGSRAPLAHAQAANGENILRREGRYLPRWLELLDTEGEKARLKAQLGDQAELIKLVMRDAGRQYAAFLGQEAIALRPDTEEPPILAATPAMKAVDAVDAIAEAAVGRQVVMLNEAHIASRHRGFLSLLMRRLRQDGFTHLATETFTEPAASLSAGDQISIAHGYYLRDPVFAEAIREAPALGYRPVPYEQRAGQAIRSDVLGAASRNKREQAQADNLAAAMAKEHGMRVLVFAGHGHIVEKGAKFAAYFKQDTGIDPLSIMQSDQGAFGPHVPDRPQVQALLDRFKPTRPVVLRPTGARYKPDDPLLLAGVDMVVLHPVLPDVDGRPGWLAADPGRRRATVRVGAGTGHRLIQAIHHADKDPAIPADQYLLLDGAAEAVLFLRPGRYRVRVETPEGFKPLAEISVA